MSHPLIVALLLAVAAEATPAWALPLVAKTGADVASSGDALVWEEPDATVIVAEADGSLRHAVKPDPGCEGVEAVGTGSVISVCNFDGPAPTYDTQVVDTRTGERRHVTLPGEPSGIGTWWIESYSIDCDHCGEAPIFTNRLTGETRYDTDPFEEGWRDLDTPELRRHGRHVVAADGRTEIREKEPPKGSYRLILARGDRREVVARCRRFCLAPALRDGVLTYVDVLTYDVEDRRDVLVRKRLRDGATRRWRLGGCPVPLRLGRALLVRRHCDPPYRIERAWPR